MVGELALRKGIVIEEDQHIREVFMSLIQTVVDRFKGISNNMRGVAGGNENQVPQYQEEASQIVFWLAGARKAIALKQTTYLMLWLALHHINRQTGGSGILPIGQQDIDPITFLVGHRHARLKCLLKSRDGTWWECIPKDRVRLFSQKKIGGYLAKWAAKSSIGDPAEPDLRCQIPLDDFKVGQQAFEALVFTTWVAERFPNGLQADWDGLTRLWGHSPDEIRHWASYYEPVTFVSGGFDSR